MNTRRSAAILALAGVPLLVPTPASATPAAAAPASPRFAGRNVNVWLSGGESTPLSACLSDAQDGFVGTKLAACRQAARHGNTLRLANTTVYVFRAPNGRIPIAHRTRAALVLSGPVAVAVNQRVNDAQDRVVDQRNACTQVAVAGNTLRLSGVTIIVNS
jgi:hypothetical protein